MSFSVISCPSPLSHTSLKSGKRKTSVKEGKFSTRIESFFPMTSLEFLALEKKVFVNMCCSDGEELSSIFMREPKKRMPHCSLRLFLSFINKNLFRAEPR
jgi:hypothetical protein